jgi:3-methyladenine DNA glycosylase AlkD
VTVLTKKGGMNAPDVIDWLGDHGSAKTIGIYQRRGAADEALGVSYKHIDTLAKKSGTDHPLALALWAREIHEARLMAARINDPIAMTGQDIRRWVSECRDYLVSDAVSECAAYMPDAPDLAAQWITSDVSSVTVDDAGGAFLCV